MIIVIVVINEKYYVLGLLEECVESSTLECYGHAFVFWDWQCTAIGAKQIQRQLPQN